MLQTLVTLHSWVRWLVLAAVLGGAVFSWLRLRAGAAWNSYPTQVEVMIVDSQVAIGASIWLFFDGWRRGVFLAVYHPVMMLSAFGVLHLAAVAAERNASARSWRIMLVASLVAIGIIVAAVPWARL